MDAHQPSQQHAERAVRGVLVFLLLFCFIFLFSFSSFFFLFLFSFFYLLLFSFLLLLLVGDDPSQLPDKRPGADQFPDEEGRGPKSGKG